jgi:hypothetical protein
VTVRRIDEDEIRATVRGDSAKVHTVTYEPNGWRCSCVAGGVGRRPCSHIMSVMLVVLEPVGARR